MTSLSLCVIVKNEEAALPRMLRSVAPFVDEIVVCDTGSTDKTVAIAREFGAKIVSAPFEDDFSAPRNVSLAAATKEWILVLDADEWLGDGAGRAIRAAIDQRRIAGYYLRFENHLGGGRIHRCGLMRLFRNDASVRFEFAIHEQVLPRLIAYAKRHAMKLAPLDAAVVHHDGYLDENVNEKGKNERNLRLFERQVRSYPDHAYSWYKYGDFLRRFPSRRTDAIRALERARDLITQMDPKDARELSFGAEVFALLALDADKQKDYAAALRLLEIGRDRFGETPNLLHVLGHVLARTGDHRGSLRAYARLRLADRRLHAIPPEPGITGPYAYFAMGRALFHMGFPRAAMRCLDESLELDGAALEPRSLRARLRLDRGDLEGAIADYRTALERHPNDAATHTRLAHVSFVTGDAPTAAREFELAIEHGADARSFASVLGQAYLVTGRLEKALDTFASNAIDENCALGLRLLELIAAGRDVRSDATFQTAAGRSWLRALVPTNPATTEDTPPVAMGTRSLDPTVDASKQPHGALLT